MFATNVGWFENSGKGVSLALGTAWIVNAFKEFQQRLFGIHASVLMSGSFPVINSDTRKGRRND